jgi:spore coat polysaccharide biosynthesis protein SpsF
MKRVVAIIQARMGSTRLPGKSLERIDGRTLIEQVVYRLKMSKLIDWIVLATTEKEQDDALARFAEQHEIECYRGSEDDVLLRFYECAVRCNAEVIVRVCADNPFLYIKGMDDMIDDHINANRDFTYNGVHKEGAPLGMVSEVISFNALERAHREAREKHQREHVTPYFKENPDKFKIRTYPVPKWLQRRDISLSIDTQKDIDRVRKIMSAFKGADFVEEKNLIEFLDKNHKLKGP